MLVQLLLWRLETQQPVWGRWPGATTNIVSWAQTELSWVFVYSHWPWLWILHSVVTLLNGDLSQSTAMQGHIMYSALGRPSTVHHFLIGLIIAISIFSCIRWENIWHIHQYSSSHKPVCQQQSDISGLWLCCIIINKYSISCKNCFINCKKNKKKTQTNV